MLLPKDSSSTTGSTVVQEHSWHVGGGELKGTHDYEHQHLPARTSLDTPRKKRNNQRSFKKTSILKVFVHV